MILGTLDALFVGKVERLTAPDGTRFPSAIRKKQIQSGSVHMGKLEDDESAEEGIHHTPDKDIHLFPSEHYGPVGENLGLALHRPTFGENFSTLGFGEQDLYVGDRIRIGSALIEITQPTERCKTIGRSLGEPRVLKVLHKLEMCGTYAKVLEPGHVTHGDAFNLVERQQDEWSILRLHQFMFNKLTDDALLEEVLAIPQLSDEWKDRIPKMRQRAAKGEALSSSLAEIANL